MDVSHLVFDGPPKEKHIEQTKNHNQNVIDQLNKSETQVVFLDIENTIFQLLKINRDEFIALQELVDRSCLNKEAKDFINRKILYFGDYAEAGRYRVFGISEDAKKFIIDFSRSSDYKLCILTSVPIEIARFYIEFIELVIGVDLPFISSFHMHGKGDLIDLLGEKMCVLVDDMKIQLDHFENEGGMAIDIKSIGWHGLPIELENLKVLEP